MIYRTEKEEIWIDDTAGGITGESFGYGQTVPNVSVQVRGQTSSRSNPKNYKIRIKDGKGKFRGQRNMLKDTIESCGEYNRMSDLVSSTSDLQ